MRLARAGQYIDSFIDHPNDGTVTHEQTGIMWAKCAVGQTYNNGVCNGTASRMNWASALAAAKDSRLAGYDDWRLPNIKELLSLVDYSTHRPSINTSLFPGTPTSLFWSSSAYEGLSSNAWYVYFVNGFAYYYSKYDSYFVRLARAGQYFDSFASFSVPDAPTIVTATPGNSSATVSFTAPTNDGGSAVTGYTVTSNPGNITATGTGSPITITGLTNGTAYTFTVTATNARGTSAPSAASNSVIPGIYYTLTTIKAGNGNGTVISISPAGGINCGTDCTESYAVNTIVSLFAATSTGSTFSGWTGSCSGTALTCKVTMSAAKSVTATFNP